jgi:hypothetical protein
VRDPFLVDLAVAGEAEEGSDHLGEARAGVHFAHHHGLLVAHLPPVVDDPGSDFRGTARTKRRFAVADQVGDPAAHDLKALDHARMAMGACDAAARCDVQLGDEHPLWMVERIGDDDRTLAGDGVLEDLAATGHCVDPLTSGAGAVALAHARLELVE